MRLYWSGGFISSICISSHETIVTVRREYFKVLRLLHWAAACQQTVFTSLSAHSCWLKKKLISSVVPCAVSNDRVSHHAAESTQRRSRGDLVPFQSCLSSLWRPRLKALSGLGDIWCYCWGCWRSRPPPPPLTQGTFAAGNTEQDSGTWKDQFSCLISWIFSLDQMLCMWQICFEDHVTTPKNSVFIMSEKWNQNVQISVCCDDAVFCCTVF